MIAMISSEAKNRCRLLFRGKRLDNNEWILGHHVLGYKAIGGGKVEQIHSIHHSSIENFPRVIISNENRKIDFATLGQCTGVLASKSYRGNMPLDLMVFEHDTVTATVSAHGIKILGEVQWVDGAWAVVYDNGFFYITSLSDIDIIWCAHEDGSNE